jgi:Iap family predicted aminopeptidase
MQDHWLPGFNFNVLALTRAVFAVAVEETPASS